MTKKNNRNHVAIEQKYLSKATKTQGLVSLGRLTFIEEIIRKFESQVSIVLEKYLGRALPLPLE